jgi:probable aminopeptidase NPEPL1
MPHSSRDRTGSKREEGLVSAYIDSTVDFESNVTFPDTLPNPLAPRILVLYPEKKDTAIKPMFWNEECDAALVDAAPGAVFSTSCTVNGERRRLNIGIVPAQASRHNCPVRPDVIVSLVQAALGNGKKTEGLDVVSAMPTGFELPIAQAVAKGANRSFTAKAGASEKGFLQVGVPVRVILHDTRYNRDLQHIATGIQLCMRLGDAPPCILDTVTFPEIAEKYAKKLGLEYECIKGEELRERGYGGIYGVGKAAEFPPALVVLSYKPKGGIAPKDKIAFVGKGIVYDTGGLSVKTPANFMAGMKMDMCGAAAVFSGLVTLARMQSPYEFRVALCLADNAIGPRSQRPDDIIVQKSGVTTEVVNTDAEGRLVLSDGVFHVAQEIPGFTPSVVIDMATLTGAQLITTGKKHAAIFTNSDEWETTFVKAGRECGDLTFPILFCPEFHNPQYESKVADFKNLCSRSDAVSSCAGQFIANNLPKDFKGAHVHVDLAGPAMGIEVATGYGVALLAHLFGK